MVVVEPRLGVGISGSVDTDEAVGTAREDGPRQSSAVDAIVRRTHEPSGEKHRRVMPLRWHGTEEMASADASAIVLDGSLSWKAVSLRAMVM